MISFTSVDEFIASKTKTFIEIYIRYNVILKPLFSIIREGEWVIFILCTNTITTWLFIPTEKPGFLLTKIYIYMKIADSVWLSLSMRDNDKCNLPLSEYNESITFLLEQNIISDTKIIH
jgi:hypothetical protein